MNFLAQYSTNLIDLAIKKDWSGIFNVIQHFSSANWMWLLGIWVFWSFFLIRVGVTN